MRSELDLIFVGGGLANCLLAWRLKQRKPKTRFLILESRTSWPKDRTWSFHGSDLAAGQMQWLRPLLSKSWQGYDVRFPEYQRSLLGSTYNTIRAKDLYARLGLDEHVIFSARVKAASEHGVTLDDGRFYGASLVLDGRGLDTRARFATAYQKFVGLNLRLKRPHGLTRPILMDANCDQLDGFRFFYALPWTEDELLVEDTRYSSSAAISDQDYIDAICLWVQEKGWQVEAILDSEAAALPIPVAQPVPGSSLPTPTIGLKGGYFHFLSGYSLPHAVELADRISGLVKLETQAIRDVLRHYEQERSWDCRCALLLNRMAFGAANPGERRRIFQRFYRFPESMIQRFYAEDLTTFDWLRMVVGKPPVSIRRAWAALRAGPEVTLC